MGTKVRILAALTLDGVPYQPNQVVDMPSAAAKSFQADGQVDANKDAIAYCLNELGATVIVHASPAAAEAIIEASPELSATSAAE